MSQVWSCVRLLKVVNCCPMTWHNATAFTAMLSTVSSCAAVYLPSSLGFELTGRHIFRTSPCFLLTVRCSLSWYFPDAFVFRFHLFRIVVSRLSCSFHGPSCAHRDTSRSPLHFREIIDSSTHIGPFLLS